MENIRKINEMIKCSALIGIGVLMPIILHLFGAAGPVFLPMHIPVIVGGFVLSAPYAAIVAIVTPIVSSLLTGMPPVYPILPIMVIELTCYAIVVNVAYNKLKISAPLSLLMSLILGRIGAGVMVAVLVLTMELNLDPIMFVKSAIITGIPGLIVQVIVIPRIVKALN